MLDRRLTPYSMGEISSTVVLLQRFYRSWRRRRTLREAKRDRELCQNDAFISLQARQMVTSFESLLYRDSAAAAAAASATQQHHPVLEYPQAGGTSGEPTSERPQKEEAETQDAPTTVPNHRGPSDSDESSSGSSLHRLSATATELVAKLADVASTIGQIQAQLAEQQGQLAGQLQPRQRRRGGWLGDDDDFGRHSRTERAISAICNQVSSSTAQ